MFVLCLEVVLLVLLIPLSTKFFKLFFIPINIIYNYILILNTIQQHTKAHLSTKSATTMVNFTGQNYSTSIGRDKMLLSPKQTFADPWKKKFSKQPQTHQQFDAHRTVVEIRPKVIIIPISYVDGRPHIIIVRDKSSGDLTFAGGGWKLKDKSFLDAACRELEEETGIKKELAMSAAKNGRNTKCFWFTNRDRSHHAGDNGKIIELYCGIIFNIDSKAVHKQVSLMSSQTQQKSLKHNFNETSEVLFKDAHELLDDLHHNSEVLLRQQYDNNKDQHIKNKTRWWRIMVKSQMLQFVLSYLNNITPAASINNDGHISGSSSTSCSLSLSKSRSDMIDFIGRSRIMDQPDGVVHWVKETRFIR